MGGGTFGAGEYGRGGAAPSLNRIVYGSAA
jgi:hypothetical protein